jgi:hypothetical protein
VGPDQGDDRAVREQDDRVHALNVPERCGWDCFAGSLVVVTVANVRAGCPGVLVETAPGSGTCERGDECEALALLPDYLSYRDAHGNIDSVWTRTRSER